jgi:predicted esterase
MIVREVLVVGAVAMGALGCGSEPASSLDAGTAGEDVGVSDDAFAPTMPDAGPPDAGPLRMDPTVPAATGACPDMSATGTVMVTPASLPARSARIWVGPEAAAMDGPIVFFWHGAGGSASEAPFALGDAAVAELLAMGGILVAPSADPTAGTFPWFLTAGGAREDDLQVADELLACAETTIGIDERRVHLVGFSAGALHATQMSFRRASYVASVVTYSGGLIGLRPPPRTDAPDARFAAMILFGGESDQVVVNFADASRNLHTYLSRNPGYFGFLCDHGLGHRVPSAARESAWRFLQDHPFGMHPHAYEEGGLPDGFYAPCTR